MTTDSLHTMLLDLRTARPRPHDGAQAWNDWLESIMQVIRALPSPQSRWACVVLVADDLARAFPGMPLSMTYGWLAKEILETEHDRGSQIV